MTTFTSEQMEQIRLWLDEAAEKGARRALYKIGLDDDNADRDIRTLRDLLSVWRDMGRTALRTLVKFFMLLALGAMVVGVWLWFGSGGVPPTSPPT